MRSEQTQISDNAMKQAMTSVSLFSGAGGLDIGFERAGFKCIWANEFDKDAAKTWRINRSDDADVMHEGDISSLLYELESLRGSVDVLFGGPPCQSWSVAGKMDPNDLRGAMVFRFIDAVRIVQPKIFLMENVKNLATSKRFEQARADIADGFYSAGYDMRYKIHIAIDYGVPQRRERVFFIGVRRDFASSIGMTGDNVLDMIDEAMDARKNEPPLLRDVLKLCGRYGSDENPQTCTGVITLTKNPILRPTCYSGMLTNGCGHPINLDGYAPTLPASMGGNQTPYLDDDWLWNRATSDWFAGYRQRLIDGTTTPLMEKIPTPRIRRLTLKEAAAIQTFPPDYEFSGAKSKRYRQIGNAVPCGLAEAAGRAIAKVLLNQ